MEEQLSIQQGENNADENLIAPPTTVRELSQAIEAILFAAGHPVSYKKLAEVLQIGEKDIKHLVKEMATHFVEEETYHGIMLLMFPDNCQLCTKETYAPYIREVLGIRRGGNLSDSSREVLAVVAYNQPVTRSFIDQVRGIDSSYHVGSLLDKGLIHPVGRLEAPGRPITYGTTDKFLRIFGLETLEDLPETQALSIQNPAVDNLADGEQLTIGDDGEIITPELNGVNNGDYTEMPPEEDEHDEFEDTYLDFDSNSAEESAEEVAEEQEPSEEPEQEEGEQ